MVQLVDDGISLFGHGWTTIVAPALGIGVAHVNDGCTLTIDTHSYSKYTGSFLQFPYLLIVGRKRFLLIPY